MDTIRIPTKNVTSGMYILWGRRWIKTDGPAIHNRNDNYFVLSHAPGGGVVNQFLIGEHVDIAPEGVIPSPFQHSRMESKAKELEAEIADKLDEINNLRSRAIEQQAEAKHNREFKRRNKGRENKVKQA